MMTEKKIKSAIIHALKHNEYVYVNDKNEIWTNSTRNHSATMLCNAVKIWINPHDVTLKKPNADGTDDTYFSHSGNSTLDQDSFLTITQLKERLTC